MPETETSMRRVVGSSRTSHEVSNLRRAAYSLAAAFFLFMLAGPCLAAKTSDCDEPETPFPIQLTKEDKPGSKTWLTKTIRKNVISEVKRIDDRSSGFNVTMLATLLDKEFGCNTGTALSTKEAEELVAILAQIYQGTFAEGKPKSRTMTRLNSLQEEIRKRGTYSSNCLKAVTELAQFVENTTREALAERKAYETATAQRKARVDECRKVAAGLKRQERELAAEKAQQDKLRAEIDRKREQEALERQKKEEEKTEKAEAERRLAKLKEEYAEKEQEKKRKSEELAALAQKYSAEPVDAVQVYGDSLGTGYIGKRVLITEMPISDIRQDPNGYYLVLATHYPTSIPAVVLYFDISGAPSVKSGDKVTAVAVYRGKVENVAVYDSGAILRKD